jgi:pimeloyl-ACP methyl ester carboxylesterase
VSAEERWVTIGGRRVRYLYAGPNVPRETAGNAGLKPRTSPRPPVLFVHGLLGYSFSWRYNLEYFAQEAEVYALDLPGTGYSERAPGMDPSMGAAAGRLLEFLDRVGVERADVVGSSHGGALGLWMAALGRSRVRRLVVAAPAHPWSRHMRRTIRVLATRPGGFVLRTLEPALWPLRGYFLERMYGDVRRIPPGTLEGYACAFRQPGTLDYVLGILRCWEKDMRRMQELMAALDGLPALMLWGTRDQAVKADSAKLLQRALPQARLVMLEGLGHLPNEEAPQEFNRIVGDFLRAPEP